MKKMKKLFAVILSLAMVLGMTVTAFAEDPKPARTPVEGETADVTIEGLGKNATVNLYRIAEGKYGQNGANGFIDYEWVANTRFEDPDSPTADEINAIAQGIQNRSLRLTPIDTQTVSGTYTYKATAGAYIAIITGGEGDISIYNPVLLTASYGKEGEEKGTLVGGTIDVATETYIGTSAVVKKSDPTFDKSVTGVTEETLTDGAKKATASVGQELTYTLDNIKVPSYPENAYNKTFYISDKMIRGLDFKYDSLEIRLIQGKNSDGTEIPAEDVNGNKIVVKKGENADGSWDGTFKIGDVVIATSTATKVNEAGVNVAVTGEEKANGFNLSFNYENLISDKTTRAIYTPVVTYKAVITSDAVVGVDGNPNDATLYYANQPNEGDTYDTTTTEPNPDTAEGIEDINRQVTVYTYQLAFKKVGDANDADEKKLKDAVFGIYTNPACTEQYLIDTVTSDENGYAMTTRVGYGIYYIKELWAPNGYSLNDKVYVAKTNQTSSTTTISGSVTNRQYTTEVNEAATYGDETPKQVGWIKDGVFYSLSYTTDKLAEMGITDARAAYIKSETTSNKTTITITNTTGEDTGTVSIIKEYDPTKDPSNEEVWEKMEAIKAIPNTSLASLPSTGGIGTTIFTIGGCVIMIAAAALFFASRKKSQK